MSKPANGELDHLADGGFSARITIRGRLRRWFILTTCSTELEAIERKAAMAAAAARLRHAGLTAPEIEKAMKKAATARHGHQWKVVLEGIDLLCAGGTEEARARVIPTFEEFAGEWTTGKLHKKHHDRVGAKDSDDDKSRLTRYVNPHLGRFRLDQITLADCDHVLANLPDELAPTTRRHVAQVIGRVLKLAVYPGCYLAVSPVPRGWLPRPGKARARGYLYPDEDAKLMACPGEKVPLWRRLLWGFMAREGTRGPSEALAFRWRHVDLQRGAVRLDANKTDDPRVWSLTPGTAKALRAWKEVTKTDTGPNDRIFVDDDGRQPHSTLLAGMLRQDLRAAGVDRPELFENSEHRMQIRAHDLRASFITVALANGRSETWVTDRTGHTTSGQLVNYRRAARTVQELELGDFKPLDEAVPELRGLPRDCPASPPTGENSGDPDAKNPGETAIIEQEAEGARLLVPLIGVRISTPEPSRPPFLQGRDGRIGRLHASQAFGMPLHRAPARTVLTTCMVAVATAGGCVADHAARQGGGDSGTSQDAAASASGIVGPSGGTVQVGRASITIPAGALSTDTTIMPEQGAPPGAAVFWSAPGGVGYDQLATTTESGLASASVMHFGTGFIGVETEAGSALDASDGGVEDSSSTEADAGQPSDATVQDATGTTQIPTPCGRRRWRVALLRR